MSPTTPPALDLEAWQQQLDFLLPRRELLRPDEVAKALGCDARTVTRLFEDYRITGHELNAGAGQRQHRRIRRASVILYLAKRANYAPSDIRDRVAEIVCKLPRPDIALLHAALGQLLAKDAR
jgi:hypothetical protein